MKTIRLILIFSIICPGLSFGKWSDPSFDCSLAKTRIEKTICEDGYLSWNDSSMSSKYKKLLSRGIVNLKHEQREWIKERDACSKINNEKTFNECVTSAYRKRINELNILSVKTDYPENGWGRYEVVDWWPTGIKTHITGMSPNDEETCRSFEGFLNDLPTKQPYVCIVESKDNSFRRPEWKTIDKEIDKTTVRKIFESLFKTGILTEHYKKLFNKGEFAIRKTTINETTDLGGTGTVYELLTHKKCEKENPEWLIKGLEKGNFYFSELQNGEFEILFNYPWFVELLMHENKTFFYTFSSHNIDINWSVLDKKIQVIDLYNKTKNRYKRSCRFQYIKYNKSINADGKYVCFNF